MEKIEILKDIELPSGENTNQQGFISKVDNGLDYEIVSDSSVLEYIDYLNLSKVVEILAEFFDVNATALAIENKLSSVALAPNGEELINKIIENDSISLKNGTIGFSKNVTKEMATQLSAMSLRNIISTNFDKDAIDTLLKNDKINIIKINNPLQELLGFNAKEINITPFGYLVQEQNLSKLTKSSFKVFGKLKPTQSQAEDAIFAWKVAKYSSTCCAVVAKDLSTKSIVQAKTNIIAAVEQAMDIACESSKDAVLATDGAINNEGVINAAIQARISTIIDAGDDANFEQYAKLANKYNISYIKTGIRNYRY